MSLKTKYNLRRKFVRMSWNKYNILILKKSKKKYIYYKNRIKKNSVVRSRYYGRFFSKQLLRRYYGDIKEKQFKNLYKKVKFNKDKGQINFFILLEKRLETVLFRMNLAPSIYASRQLINHGHVLVNNKVVRGGNYLLKIFDIVKIKKKSLNFVKSLIKIKRKTIKHKLLKRYKFMKLPINMMVNYRTLSGIYLFNPSYNQIRYPFKLNKKYVIRYFLAR